MNHVFQQYKQDFKELAETLKTDLNSLSNPIISHDQQLILINKVESDLEEAHEIVQQLEYSAQNSGQIATERPVIDEYLNIIRDRKNDLEKITGVQSKPKSQKKIRFDEANIVIREDVDNYVEEEDLDDLRNGPKSDIYLRENGFVPFVKRNALKITVVGILALAAALIVIFVYMKKNQNSPDQKVH
ncbi:hypothetical protein SAMD00019534_126060 [Acytostelium subglobosum LB1]|uniref:hypothetical protein n=1 Tax=Acytostelium subglobosum LB1 TaxID=1410327 RepID=UPI0006448713|nr:hypothetical protein SAMD00019534_126060 [Acytostelium subglobosum LB1]GAM29430.1 hypothetical protein SAMD00019534_126060 [Acytostelium subglobosum LB1]|eukprot:XP_012747621.1 hypothetical protein SAMD00019534_126060 [Acytostelium subglobosum LB1]